MEFTPMSVRRKLIAIVLLTTLTALLVSGAAMVAYDIRTYRLAAINDITTQTELLSGLAAAALNFDDAEVAREDLGVLRFRPQIAAAAVYNVRGALFASFARDAHAATAFPSLPGDEGVYFDGDRIYAFKRIVEHGEILGSAYVSSDYGLRTRLLNNVAIAGVTALGALLVAVLVSIRLQSLITRPILSIAAIARDVVSRREYSQRAEKLSNDEVGSLVDAFNDMLSEIEHRTEKLELSNRELAREVAERRRVDTEMQLLNADLERRVQERTAQLATSNTELESFCYSVSHDLRAPLRAIDGFSQALAEELPAQLPGQAQLYFDRIRAATLRMGQLIEDLLNLSKVTRVGLDPRPVDLSAVATEVVRDLQNCYPDRKVAISIWDGMMVTGDARLLRVVLENLVGNAWKFTSRTEQPRIEIGTMRDGQRSVYFVRDNGAGFDMAYADKLFGAFQRLHGAAEFPGTGIGLATVQRIVGRHGGRIWPDAAPGKGAAFFFTLSRDPQPDAKTLEAAA